MRLRAAPRHLARWAAAAVLLALVAFAYFRSTSGYAFTGTPAPSDMAPPLRLENDRGGVFDLSAEHGRVVLIYFGYTDCPNVCAPTLRLLDGAVRRLGSDQGRIEQVFVTLDPKRDTPDRLRAFLAASDPSAVGLTGAPATIASAAKAWGVTWRRVGDSLFLDHTSVVAVVGPDGRERLRYGVSQLGDEESVARDLTHVLHGG